MKKSKSILIVICCIVFFGCNHKPEFYIDGKPFYTESRCIEHQVETKYEYHYGYNMLRGKHEWHFGPNTKTKCVQSVIDTIEIK